MNFQLFPLALFILATGLVGIAFGWLALAATFCALIGIFLLIADFRLLVKESFKKLSK